MEGAHDRLAKAPEPAFPTISGGGTFTAQEA